MSLFVAGILAGHGCSWGPAWSLEAGAAGLLLAGLASLAMARRKLGLLSLGLCFCLLGIQYQRHEHRRYRVQSAQLAPCAGWMAEGESCRLEGTTQTMPVPSLDGEALEATVLVDKIWRRDAILTARVPVLLRIYLSTQEQFEWNRGHRLQFLARLSWPRGFRNEGAGNPKIYYWNRNIVALATCKSPGLITRLSDGPPPWLDGLNGRIEREIGREVPDRPVAQVLKALLLGRSVSTPELRSAYVDAGVYHLLVISGAHLSLIALALVALFGLIRMPEWLRCLWLILLLWLYVDFVQYQVSVVRAFVIVAVYLLGKMSYQRASLLNSTALAALGLLAWHPWFLWDAGFQLTFLSVFALALLAAPLAEQCVRPLTLACRDLFTDRVRLEEGAAMNRARRWRFGLEEFHFFWLGRVPSRVFARSVSILSKPLAGLGRLVLATWAVLVVSVPLLASLHFPLPVSGLLWSTVATVLIAPILGILLLVPVLLAGGSGCADGAIQLAATLAEWLNGLILGAEIDPLWILPLPLQWAVIYLLGLGAGIWLLRRRIAMAFLLMGVLLAAAFWWPGRPPAGLCLTMLDVGDGDSLLLRTPEGDAVMIDTGGIPSFDRNRIPPKGQGDLSRRVLIPLLLEKGVRHLDALVLSHLDFDHAGSTPGLLDAFSVAQVCCAEAEWRRQPELAAEIAAALHRRRTPLRLLARGDRLRFHSLEMEIIHPERGGPVESGNNNSLVAVAEWAGSRILFTGDIEEPVERRLRDGGKIPQAEVLKCAHHGSRTSSSEEFIAAVRPAVALISAGAPWRYYHPSPQVVNRLRRRGVVMLNTWDHGQVELQFGKPGFEVRLPMADRNLP